MGAQRLVRRGTMGCAEGSASRAPGAWCLRLVFADQAPGDMISTRGVAKVNFLSITQNGKRMCAWLEEVQSGHQWVRPSVAKPFASDRP
jgi:hypothetical protein